MNDTLEQPVVFLSHNKQDRAVAREIALYLSAEGVRVWFDEWEVTVGDSLVDAIGEGIRSATHLVLVWSTNASFSGWVEREVQSQVARAASEGSPKILPIRVDSTPLPPLLQDIRYHAWNGGTEEDRAEIVRGVLGRDPTDLFIEAVVRKYNELVRDETQPIPFNACPECGATDLVGMGSTNAENNWVQLVCPRCGWKQSEIV